MKVKEESEVQFGITSSDDVSFFILIIFVEKNLLEKNKQ